ncbi:MAG: hypothetical protein QW220_00540 [Candidatus Bathyarchaeia archaeon]
MVSMPKYCPECGGELRYDPEHKLYTCRSCGLTLNIDELIRIQDEARLKESEEERRRRERKEYLKWWLSKK